MTVWIERASAVIRHGLIRTRLSTLNALSWAKPRSPWQRTRACSRVARADPASWLALDRGAHAAAGPVIAEVRDQLDVRLRGGLDDPVGPRGRSVVRRAAPRFAPEQQLAVQAVDAVAVMLGGVVRVLIRPGVSGRVARAAIRGGERAVEYRVPLQFGLAQPSMRLGSMVVSGNLLVERLFV